MSSTRLTVTLQVASEALSPEELQERLGCTASQLTLKGALRDPRRGYPKANLWNGSVILTDITDLDVAVRRCLAEYPLDADRLNALKNLDPTIRCTLHVGLAPFSKDFVLVIEPDTMQRLATLGCLLNLEYFPF